jgi:hypothetical protein
MHGLFALSMGNAKTRPQKTNPSIQATKLLDRKVLIVVYFGFSYFLIVSSFVHYMVVLFRAPLEK